MSFKKRDADTAVVTGNFSKINRGEKYCPPHRPTIAGMKEAQNMITNNKASGMSIMLLFLNQHRDLFCP
jgi:hypothetical protein